MEDTHLITAGGALAIAIIGYFIKGLINQSRLNHESAMSEIKTLETKVNTNTTKIEVLGSNHANLDKKIDSIFEAIKGLSQDIKDINNKRHD